MGIINLDGFDFIINTKNGALTMIVTGENSIDEINYIQNKNIKSIYLTFFKSKKINDLEFLKELKFIEEVNLNDLNIDYSGLYQINSLKKITLDVKNKYQQLDFSYFPKLEYLSVDWYQNFPDLSKNENLKELSIWKFKPKSKSFAELSLPKNLEKLTFTQSNIISLEGLELHNLKQFEGHYCSALESVKGIDQFCNNLNILILDYCKKLTTYEDLKHAVYINKIILGDCGDMQNLKWLKELKQMNHISFWNTNIVDGDITPCIGIDYVAFNNKRHYNLKEEYFNK